jgi:predicted transcriptional regulator
MKDKYIPDLIMSVIWKNHGNDSKNFIRKGNDDYISSEEDAMLISLQELRDTLEDIFGEEK